jgi:hypothetical protein
MGRHATAGSETRDRSPGRPKKPPEKRRTKSLGLSLSPEEKRELEKRAEAHGLSQSEYLRRRAFGHPIQPKSDQTTRAELRRIGNGLNQVARRADTDGLSEIEDKAEAVLSALEEALSKLRQSG